MRRFAFVTALGLWLAPLAGLADAREQAAPKPADKAAPEGTCSFGTSLEFEDTPSLAAKKALKEKKLVFVLHVSGNFEDPRFT